MVEQPLMWFVGIIVTLNLAVLGVLWTLLMSTHDETQRLAHELHGGGEGYQTGFIERTETRQDTMHMRQREIYERTDDHGQMLLEMAVVLGQIGEAIDEMNGHEVETARVQWLREQYEDEFE